jgi:hypothetical protein
MYKKGNIVTVMFLNGMELIGTLVSEGEDMVVIDKPMLCQATKDGVSFSPAISLTGDVVDGELELVKRNVMYILKTLDAISEAYTKRLSDIVTPEEARIIA